MLTPQDFLSLSSRFSILCMKWWKSNGADITKLRKNSSDQEQSFADKLQNKCYYNISPISQSLFLSCRPQHRWFSVKFEKILKHSFFYRTSPVAASFWSILNNLFNGFYALNPFVPNAPFLYSLKTSENLQGVRERVHRKQMG